jgi:hypothetical protein
VDLGNTAVVRSTVGYEWVPLLLQTLVGIGPAEVRQVLEGDRRWPRPAIGDGLPMLAIWGRTRNGRYLIVVLRATDVSHDWLIVGARKMAAEEAAEYDRWEAGHGQ